MNLGKRLSKVLSLIEDGADTVFDIGADHGHLTFKLVKEKNVKKVYASDISAPSINKTIELVNKYNLEDRVTCLVSDGLKSFPDDLHADYIVIAGMGGNEIVKILSEINNGKLYNNFILQPMQDPEIVREYLSKNFYKIMSDDVVEEKGKFYSVILTSKTNKKIKLKSEELWFGKNYLTNKTEDFISYVKRVQESLERRRDFLSEVDLKKLKKCDEILNK